MNVGALGGSAAPAALRDLDSLDGGPGCCISLPVSTERARLCEVAMGLDCLLLATSLGITGCDESVLANQSSRISKRVTGTQSLSIFDLVR